jgi:hypothetical protein
MNIRCNRLIAVVLGLGLLSIAPSAAADTTISIRYAGTGIDTAVDTDEDTFTVSLDQARAKGTFGNSTIAITAEFTPTGEECSAKFPVELSLVYSAAVITFPDLSQLFGIAREGDGRLCLNPLTGLYDGEVEGTYEGGTGRFESASGTFTSPFNGQFLDVPVGFRSITGSVEGTVSRR